MKSKDGGCDATCAPNADTICYRTVLVYASIRYHTQVATQQSLEFIVLLQKLDLLVSKSAYIQGKSTKHSLNPV